MDWMNAVIQGVLLGGLYALFAAGLSLVFGIMRVVNLAHGDFIILAAFLSVVVVGVTGLGPFLSLVIVVPLMGGLGYERYGAGGGDFGAGVTTLMALDEPRRMIGIHLSNLELSPWMGEGSRPLSSAESAYLAQRQRWDASERGYSSIQSTKPQTLAYALNDSPAGLAAWILEKWRSWADTKGSLEHRFSRDFLLTLVTLYWVTETITTSMRDYFDNRWHGITLGPDDFVRVPTGIANFIEQLVFEGDPPREWAERLYDVRHWTRMPSGGHFAPAEEPELLARDIATFFATL